MTGVKGLGTVTGGVGGSSTLSFSKYEGPATTPSLPTTIKGLADLGGGSGIFEPSWEPYTGPSFEEIPSIAAAQVGAALGPSVTPIEQTRAPSAAAAAPAAPTTPPEPKTIEFKITPSEGKYVGVASKGQLPTVPSNIDELALKSITQGYSPEEFEALKVITEPTTSTPSVPETKMKLRIMAVDPSTGKGYPESAKDLTAAARAALRKYYPDGEKTGINEKIATLAPGYAPLVITKSVKPEDLVAFMSDLEKVAKSGGYRVDSQLTLHTDSSDAAKGLKPFSELPVEQQKLVLTALAKDGIDKGMSVGIVADSINNLLSSVSDSSKKQSLELFVRNGELDKSMRSSDAVWSATHDVKDWVGSREGQLTIGGAAGLLGTIGGFATAGPAGALVGAGMSIFATTELANLFGMDPFRHKAELEAAGLWPDDHTSVYNSAERQLKDELESFRYDAKKMSEKDAKARLEQLRQELDDLGNTLGDKWPFLVANNQYDTKLSQYKALRNYFDEVAATALTGAGSAAAAAETPAKITIANVPDGWKVELGTIKFGSGKDVTAQTKDTVSGPLKITTKDGTVYYGPDYKVYPGGAPLIIGDVRDFVEKQSKYSKSEEPAAEGKVTIYVPPGYTASYLGQKMEGGESGRRYDISGKPGTQLSVLFEAEGKKPDVLNTMIPLGGGWKEETKYLEDTYKPTEAPKYGIAALNFEPTQTVFIDGMQIDPAKYGLGVFLQPGYHTVSVNEPGYKPTTKTVYVAAGTTTSLSLKGLPEPVKSTTPSYGGGGGGGGGGGYSAPSKATYGLIVFGPTCEGATVFLDGAQIYPELGKQYSISPGYHSIELSKAGYERWTKTVYISEGDTLTVSPAFTALPSSAPVSTGTPASTSTKRIYFSSKPSGAKVLIDERWTGEWTPSYYDVEVGYHIVSFLKTGYKIPDIALWVGETILWGEAATAAAQAAGVI